MSTILPNSSHTIQWIPSNCPESDFITTGTWRLFSKTTSENMLTGLYAAREIVIRDYIADQLGWKVEQVIGIYHNDESKSDEIFLIQHKLTTGDVSFSNNGFGSFKFDLYTQQGDTLEIKIPRNYPYSNTSSFFMFALVNGDQEYAVHDMTDCFLHFSIPVHGKTMVQLIAVNHASNSPFIGEVVPDHCLEKTILASPTQLDEIDFEYGEYHSPGNYWMEINHSRANPLPWELDWSINHRGENAPRDSPERIELIKKFYLKYEITVLDVICSSKYATMWEAIGCTSATYHLLMSKNDYEKFQNIDFKQIIFEITPSPKKQIKLGIEPIDDLLTNLIPKMDDLLLNDLSPSNNFQENDIHQTQNLFHLVV